MSTNGFLNPAQTRFLTLVLGSIGLACSLGLCVNVITANLAVEYFTVHHPRIVDSDSPWVMAVIWGIGATWWCGAIGGVIVAVVNHRRLEPLTPKLILKWVAIACGVIWLVMMSIVIAVYFIAGTIPESKRRPTFDFDRRIMSVAMAHQYEYLFAAIALIIIAILTWRKNSPASL